MQALEDILNELGIVLPLSKCSTFAFHISFSLVLQLTSAIVSNDSYQGQNFAPGIGNTTIGDVEVYGLDSYPQVCSRWAVT